MEGRDKREGMCCCGLVERLCEGVTVVGVVCLCCCALVVYGVGRDLFLWCLLVWWCSGVAECEVGDVECECSCAKVMMVSAVSVFCVVDVSSFDCAKMLEEMLLSCCLWCSCNMCVSWSPASQRTWLHCCECEGESATGGVMDGINDVGGLFAVMCEFNSVVLAECMFFCCRRWVRVL